MPAPTFTFEGRMCRVSYGTPLVQRLDVDGWRPIDLAVVAKRHAADSDVWRWLTAHGVARPDNT
jgi:hypothetical protein